MLEVVFEHDRQPDLPHMRATNAPRQQHHQRQAHEEQRSTYASLLRGRQRHPVSERLEPVVRECRLDEARVVGRATARRRDRTHRRDHALVPQHLQALGGVQRRELAVAFIAITTTSAVTAAAAVVLIEALWQGAGRGRRGHAARAGRGAGAAARSE